MASYNALLQRIVPNRLRGRVFGLSDVATMAGLLLATGLLGIPEWPALDRYIGLILLGVTLVVLGSAIVSLVVRLRSGRLQGKLGFWWNVTEFYCKWWFRLKREGLCTVPPEGPVIVVANHTCSIDPLLLIASTPNRVLSFVVAAEFSDIPIAGRLTRMIGCIPVRRDGQDAAGTRIALRHLKEGNSLGIFIQGGIVPPGETREPKDGAAMLALHTGALVVPAHISGTIYDEGVVRSFFRRHKARVRFGKPIDLSRHWIPKADKKALSQISRMLMDRINELGEEEEG
jgi:1-acyl-sn-glycerol-3-phosphate acyltransferase